MRKRTFILIVIAFLLFYSSFFLKNIVLDFFESNHEKKQELILKLKIDSQEVMFEIIGDLELLLNKEKNLDKNEKDDLEKKFNKLIKSYDGLINSKTKYDLSKNFNSFFYHAELIEYSLNKNLTYFQINEKYQNYISIFYDQLEFANENKK